MTTPQTTDEPQRNDRLVDQLRLVEKIDFWLTFDHKDVQRLMLEAANEIEGLWVALDLEQDTYGDNQLNKVVGRE